jgi:hypothetical protein
VSDRIGDVLVAGSHRGARPAHDAHHGALGHPEEEQNCRGSVVCIVQARVAYASDLQQPFHR